MYVLIDDWYQLHGQPLLDGKAGAKPRFSDSEMMTLMVGHDFVPYPGETQYLGYVRSNHLRLFPQLVGQSQYNRRARALQPLVERLRRHWLGYLGGDFCRTLLLDTKPVPVVGYKRSKSHSDFAGWAGYGWCAARHLHYYGFKLVLLATRDGLPVAYEVVSANTDERAAAETVLAHVQDCLILADKGFIGEDWQAAMAAETGNQLLTFKRANQKQQNPPELDRWLAACRERIEGVFHQLQNTGRNLERLLAKTVVGLCTRVTAKITTALVKVVLQRDFGIDVQSFSIPH
jgi:hypothetical protein